MKLAFWIVAIALVAEVAEKLMRVYVNGAREPCLSIAMKPRRFLAFAGSAPARGE